MTTSRGSGLVESLVAQLSDPEAAEPAAGFPKNPTAVAGSGLYSWWADDEARQTLGQPLAVVLPPLIYAGQTGATSRRARVERVATLQSRIGRNHLQGNAGSSTFRKTISALLLETLDLKVVAKDKLDEASNQKITAWMQQHLAVTTVRIDDRETLLDLEEAVLCRLDPPLNLMGMKPTAIRARLSRLRRHLIA